ncbi:hypothetical protein LBMAG53_06670 [Planctomycetota bacterium]|nr:hypothetical protein LBMAG53_06670 [Planctomycetota bacterium]
MTILKTFEGVLERGIFSSRWLLAPLYVGLIIAQAFYAWQFGYEVWSQIIAGILEHGHIEEKKFMLSILTLIDMVMVANLIVIVLIGGYATFVSKLDLDDHEDRPAWLDHIDPGTLKTKLAGGLVGVSGIHLLQSFVHLGEEGSHIDSNHVILQIVIHAVFTIAVLIMAWADLMVERKVEMQGGHEKKDSGSAGDAH